MNKIYISVIIPIYNVEKYLYNCLNSLINQSLKNIEVIMIDDGSDDYSGKIAKKFSEDDNRFIYIYQENSGPGAARNYGLDKASGEYVFFLDSDDKLSDSGLEYLYEKAEDYKADIVIGKMIWDYKSEGIVGNYLDNIFKSSDYILSKNDFYNINIVTAQLIRRSLIEENGIRFQENVTAEDVEFAIKLQNYSQKFISIPRVVYIRTNREDEENKSITQRFDLKILEDRLESIERIAELDLKSSSELNRFIKIRSNLNYLKNRIISLDDKDLKNKSIKKIRKFCDNNKLDIVDKAIKSCFGSVKIDENINSLNLKIKRKIYFNFIKLKLILLSKCIRLDGDD